MAETQVPDAPRRSIPFTIDGQSFATDEVSQKASDLLLLAGLSPDIYDLGEIRGKDRPETKRFDDQEVVEIQKDAPVRVHTPDCGRGLMQPGVQRFINDMTQVGFVPKVEADLVILQVVPVEGAHAGCPVETGVVTGELESWPQVPPHWIHLPENVRFPRTNSQTSSKSGWLMHSRQLKRVGRCPTRGVLVQPRPSGLVQGQRMTPRATSVAMTAETEQALLRSVDPGRWSGGPLSGHIPALNRAYPHHRFGDGGDPT